MALEDLTLYESAAIAAQNAKKEAGLAVASMADFYQQRGMGEDPVIQGALQRATVGLESDLGISDSEIVNAIGVYSQKYEKIFVETKFSDLVKYLGEGYDIPKEAKDGLAVYGNATLMDLAKGMNEEGVSEEDKKSIQKAISAINMLKDRKFRAKTLGIVNGNTSATLSQLYPAENPEKKEA